MSWRRAISIGAMSWIALGSNEARADGSDAKRAEALHEEAVAFVDEGNYAAACPRFAESQKLDPAIGTQFNLADCYEHVGRTGTALAIFLEVEKAAHTTGKAKLEARAHARAEALVPKVARLVFVFTEPKLAYDVKVDAERVTPHPTGVPADPGEHTIEVASEGRRPWRSRVTLAEKVRLLEIAVPSLAIAEREVIVVRGPEQDPNRGRAMRMTGLALAGVGVIGVGLGAAFGVAAIARKNEAQDLCGVDDPLLCHDEAGDRRWDDAAVAGNISTIAFVAGASLLAIGGALWFTAPRSGMRAALGPRGQFTLQGTF